MAHEAHEWTKPAGYTREIGLRRSSEQALACVVLRELVYGVVLYGVVLSLPPHIALSQVINDGDVASSSSNFIAGCRCDLHMSCTCRPFALARASFSSFSFHISVSFLRKTFEAASCVKYGRRIGNGTATKAGDLSWQLERLMTIRHQNDSVECDLLAVSLM